MKGLVLVAASGLALAACGGDGGGISWRDPGSLDLTFGTPSSELSTAEASALARVENAFESALAFPGDTDPETAEWHAGDDVTLPHDLTVLFQGSLLPPPPFYPSLMETVRAQAQAPFAGGSASVLVGGGYDNPECWSMTADRIRYATCTLDRAEGETTLHGVMNGTIGRADGHVFWDLTLLWVFVEGEESARLTNRYRGDLTFSTAAGTFTGFARWDEQISLQQLELAQEAAGTIHAAFDLEFATDPAPCIAEGQVTVKQLWSQVPGEVPEDAPEDMFEDTGVQFTWQGCGEAGVARPVP